MAKIALGVEYDGSSFHGWQKQPELRTVQATLEEALSKIANQTIETICAGRTDTGVHALGQVVHFETNVHRNESNWVLGTNSFLPADVRVLWAKTVTTEFNARFSATARRYHYIIFNHKIKPALLRNYLSWEYQPLDHEKMQLATAYLLGEHDFSSFRGSACQSKSVKRTILEISVKRQDKLIRIDIQANAFLHHMVRNIAGVLIEIGKGNQSVSWAQTVLQAKNRSFAAITASPTGLYLVEVTYPAQFLIPLVDKSFIFNVDY